MSGACDNFILEDQSCEWFELVQYVESFDMGINFLEGPPGPPGPAGEAIFIPSVSEDGWISWTNTAGLPNPDPVYIKGPPGGGGSGDYDDLTDKPSINGVTLSGNKTTAELLIRFSAADVGLGNVANERQYSAQNPPPYPVTSVAGKTGAVDLLPSDVGLGNVANERQYSSQNPPPYPVTSVDGKTGAVSVLPIGGTAGQVLKKASTTDYDVEWDDESGGGSSDYADLTNKPSINGVTLSGNKTSDDLGITAPNIGALPDSLFPTVYYNTETQTTNGNVDKSLTVSGDGFVIISNSIQSDSTSDTGTVRAIIGKNGTRLAYNQNNMDNARAYPIGSSCSAATTVSDGDTILLSTTGTKNGSKYIYRVILCFGCTVS